MVEPPQRSETKSQIHHRCGVGACVSVMVCAQQNGVCVRVCECDEACVHSRMRGEPCGPAGFRFQWFRWIGNPGLTCAVQIHALLRRAEWRTNQVAATCNQDSEA